MAAVENETGAKMNELAWVAEARKHIGMKEIPGKQHNPVIVGWLKTLKAWWSDDETPWCGTFVAHCCRTAGRDLPQHWYRAKAWADAGRRLNKPAYGCLAVFERSGGGHVGFVVGQDARGNLMVLGGNQSNAVNIMPFARSRVTAFVWPDVQGRLLMPAAGRYTLPLLQSNGRLSTNEA